MFSLFVEISAHQRRGTRLAESLRGVRGPNTGTPLRSLRPEYSMSIIQSHFGFMLHIVGVKNQRRLLVHRWKTVLCYATSLRPYIYGFSL